MNLTPIALRISRESEVSRNSAKLIAGDILRYSDRDNNSLWTITSIGDGLIAMIDEDGYTHEVCIDDLDCCWSIKTAKKQRKMTFRNDDYPLYEKWITWSDKQAICV